MTARRDRSLHRAIESHLSFPRIARRSRDRLTSNDRAHAPIV
ncbi:Hypothetical protein A7982_09212 [Minicystis rosea]|nr:Hypothetical protein A7982_09212 [Minicystis rosea]